MCGIAGIFSYRESGAPVSADWLVRVRDAMAVRGPDGAGLWISANQRVGLAHRRLAIIDLSDAGSQPMAADEGNLQITFNGEIYNYRELKRELEREGVSFRSNSDTEVLLQLYRRHGTDMVRRLRGMFAFAIWDARNNGLFLARDAFGIKPLYYADDGRALRFASQVKALVKGGDVDMAPDAAGHAGFFLWGYVPEPYTLHKGIRALPAGTSMWIGVDGRRSQSTFFSIKDEYAQAVESPFPGSRNGAIDHVREALSDSVRHHMVADVPVGVFLSAGLDSTMLAGYAAEQASQRVHTMTLGFEEYRATENDETILAEQAARGFGTQHLTRFITRKDFSASIEHLLKSMDQPSIDGVNTYLISKIAAEAGLKVVLSGIGGDELFGTYPSFRDVPALARYLPSSVFSRQMGSIGRQLLSPLLSRYSSPKIASLIEYGGSYGGAYLLRRGLFMPWELPSILSPALADVGLSERRDIDNLNEAVAELQNDHARVSTLELEMYMRGQLLRDADWAGMAHSIEIRVPYVDVNLFRAMATVFCSGHKIAKSDIASVFSERLPEESIVRRKTGFAVPVREWLQEVEGDGSGERGLRRWAKRVNLEAGVLAAQARFKDVRRVLIYRFGSLGDTVVALPCFHVIARVFAKAERKVLTNFPVSSMAPPLEAILGSSGLVHGYISYPTQLRNLHSLWHLYKEIRKARPEVLVYLTGYRGFLSTIRDAVFFKLCGIGSIFGVPYGETHWRYKIDSARQEYEYEAQRLARTLENLAPVDLSEAGNWDLNLSPGELGAFEAHVKSVIGAREFIACSVGTKVDVKDWGEKNWLALFGLLASEYSSRYALVLLGASEDAERSATLQSIWKNASVNLCGDLSPRESAAVLSHASMFLGHDSGPMHLAAAVGIRTVSIFAARALPGVWFPYGGQHEVLYHQTPCFNCNLEVCHQYAKQCILSIRVDEVMNGVRKVLPLVTQASTSMPVTAKA